MKKQVRINHLKSDEVEIELFAEFDFSIGDVKYRIIENDALADITYYYDKAKDIFIEYAHSWGWTTSDCERS